MMRAEKLAVQNTTMVSERSPRVEVGGEISSVSECRIVLIVSREF